MHRQSASRTGEQDDQQRGAQTQPRINATASQQSVLNLQQGVGNSLTGQIVQRTPQVIRRAGDKLAFEQDEGVGLEESEVVKAVAGLIDKHRAEKRLTKDEIEGWKEGEIGRADGESREVKLRLAQQQSEGLPKDIVKFLKSQNEEATIGEHKRTLGHYHERVEKESGWKWRDLESGLLEIPTIKLDGTAQDGHVKVYGGEQSKLIYHVYFGKNRFNPVADQGRVDTAQNVFTKRGFKPGTTPAKEFVADNNEVKTRRIVTRAVTIWHLASMFGLTFKSIPESEDKDVAKGFDDTTGERTDAQAARYNGTDFAGHRETFRLWDAAAYLGESDQGGAEFKAHYDRRSDHGEPHLDEHYEPMNPGKKTGFDFTTGYERDRHDDMGLNERASMQVRNGSGDFQPFLSTASTQIDPTGKRKPKIIRANKGERFDTGAENQATVKVDLAEAKKQGIEIVNQHDDESHEHKIAWDRFYDKKDIETLAERFELARKYSMGEYAEYAEMIKPTEQDLEVFEEGDREKIRNNKAAEVFNKHYIKREAPEELDEYIYSARKNREVLMKKIPLSCVTEILLNGEPGKWPGLETLETKTWYPFDQEVQSKLKIFLRGSEDEQHEDYKNIQEMYRVAAVQKKEEGGTRV